jgi:hypothetical protein
MLTMQIQKPRSLRSFRAQRSGDEREPCLMTEISEQVELIVDRRPHKFRNIILLAYPY